MPNICIEINPNMFTTNKNNNNKKIIEVQTTTTFDIDNPTAAFRNAYGNSNLLMCCFCYCCYSIFGFLKSIQQLQYSQLQPTRIAPTKRKVAKHRHELNNNNNNNSYNKHDTHTHTHMYRLNNKRNKYKSLTMLQHHDLQLPATIAMSHSFQLPQIARGQHGTQS